MKSLFAALFLLASTTLPLQADSGPTTTDAPTTPAAAVIPAPTGDGDATPSATGDTKPAVNGGDGDAKPSATGDNKPAANGGNSGDDDGKLADKDDTVTPSDDDAASAKGS